MPARSAISAMVAALLFLTLPATAMDALPGPLVSTAWVAGHLPADGLVVLDIRSADAFQAGHIPGSQQTNYPQAWQTEREGVPGVLPSIGELEAYVSSLGAGPDSNIVVVPAGGDSTELGGATWIYWVLTYLGHDAVAILDGGWNAWNSEGYPTEVGPAARANIGSFVATPRQEILATTDHVAARIDTDTTVIDARPAPQYAGETQSGLVVRPGHIPGAVNIDNALFYDPVAHRLKQPSELAALLPATLAVRSAEYIVYCNTGHWSSIEWFVLHELLGFTDVRLYEGSMAEWSRNPELPMVVGPAPD